MKRIGIFWQRHDYYLGLIRTRHWSCTATLEPQSVVGRDSRTPDFLIHSGDHEIGAVWKHSGAPGRPYLSVVLAAPGSLFPIHGRLYELRKSGQLVLIRC